MPLHARPTLEQLRDTIRQLERKAPARAAFVPTGWDPVDGSLPGRGLPRGAVTELVGGPASGKTALALSVLARVLAAEGAVAAYVDGRHELYPPAAAAMGIPLDRLLVVRPQERDAIAATKAALWAAEALLASGAFQGVAIDVPVDVLARHAPSAAGLDVMLRRIRAAAEKGGAIALWLATPGTARVSADARIELSTGDAGWRVERVHGRAVHAAAAAGPAFTAIHAA